MLCYEFPVCLGFLAARQSTSSKLGDLVLILSLTRKHILNAFSEPGWYTCFAHILSLNLQQSWEAGDIVSIFYDDKALSLCEGGGARLSDFLGLNELSLSITLWIQIVVHRMYLNLRPILWDPVPPLPPGSSFSYSLEHYSFSSLDTAQLPCRQILYCLSHRGSPGQRAWRSTSMGWGGEAWILVSRGQCFLGCGLESYMRQGLSWMDYTWIPGSKSFWDSRHKPIDFHFATQPGLFINTV